MKLPTSIEVKCECIIPFHSELNRYLEHLSDGVANENNFVAEIPHREAIVKALGTKMLFIILKRPVRKFRPKLLSALKQVLNKDLVGTIKVGKDEITLILR